jgi:hypothetical protein
MALYDLGQTTMLQFCPRIRPECDYTRAHLPITLPNVLRSR